MTDYKVEIANNNKLLEGIKYTSAVDVQTGYLYIGEALPGTEATSAKWRIAKVDTEQGGKTWANGTTRFDKVWNDRATYNYS